MLDVHHVFVRQIRDGVARMVISRGDSFKQALRKKDVLKWLEFMDIEFGTSALFKGDKFIGFLYEALGVKTFEELEIPWQIWFMLMDAKTGKVDPAYRKALRLE